jgi:hypothetical protein
MTKATTVGGDPTHDLPIRPAQDQSAERSSRLVARGPPPRVSLASSSGIDFPDEPPDFPPPPYSPASEPQHVAGRSDSDRQASRSRKASLDSSLEAGIQEGRNIAAEIGDLVFERSTTNTELGKIYKTAENFRTYRSAEARTIAVLGKAGAGNLTLID